MRLIDAAVLLDKHAEQCGEKCCDTCRFIGKEKCASYMAITETPTAFDIEAVVKELEGLKAEYKEGWDEGNHEDDYGAYFAIENAIEIVRKGGVKND